MRPALKPIILGVGAPWSFPGSSADMRFTTGQGAINRQPVGLGSLLSTTRAQTVPSYAQTASGLLVPFAANTPRITDNGLLVEEARTNLALQSNDISNSSWSKTGGGTGSSPTATANSGTAPDGTLTASRVQFALNSGISASDNSTLGQNITVSSGSLYAETVWLKSNTASSYSMRLIGNGGAANIAVTVTPTWQRFTNLYTAAGVSDFFRLQLRGAQTPTNNDSADILVWGAQLELGAFATSNIHTTTVAVNRAADVITLTGAAATAALAASKGPGWLYAKYFGSPVSGNGGIISVSDGSFNNNVDMRSNTTALVEAVATSGGVARFDITSGSVALGALATVAMTLQVGNSAISVNGGTAATATPASLPAAQTTAKLGSLGTGNFYINNYIKRVAIGLQYIGANGVQARSAQ